MQNKKSFFGIKERGSNVLTEILAGFTTFATMAYVLVVHTGMMIDAGMDGTGVMLSTALISGIITIAMGLYSNLPFALAPGMGSNAILAYTLVAQGICTWQVGIGMFMISGVVFVLLSLFRIREKVVEWIPKVLKIGVGAGVGIFLIRLSVINAGLVAPNFGGLGDFSDPNVLLAAIGLGITLFLYFFRIEIKGHIYQIRGSLLFSIIITTIIGICMGLVELPESIFTHNALSSLGKVAFQLDVKSALNISYFSYILVFFMGDFFSTLGTALGVAGKAGLLDEDGNLPAIGKVFLCDAVGTCVGAAFGLTTVTTYVESASGVEAGRPHRLHLRRHRSAVPSFHVPRAAVPDDPHGRDRARSGRHRHLDDADPRQRRFLRHRVVPRGHHGSGLPVLRSCERHRAGHGRLLPHPRCEVSVHLRAQQRDPLLPFPRSSSRF